MSIRALNRDEAGRIALLVAVGILLIGLPVPIPIRALLEVGIMAGAVAVTVLGLSRGTDFRVARIAYLLTLALYLALLLHSNLPGIRVGVEGIRYAMVAVSGLMLGLALPDRVEVAPGRRNLRLIPAISMLLLVAAAASLIIHLYFPDVETSFDRAAALSTTMLGGQMRMQGLLSGPFHVAMLGAFLTLAGAWQLIRRQPVGLILLVVGETVLLLARVRSGLIATVLGFFVLAALAWFQRDADPRLRGLGRLRFAGGLAVVPLLVVLVSIPISTGNGIDGSASSPSGTSDAPTATNGGGNSALTEFEGISGDHRTKSRLKAIEEATDLSLESPITGWGPGSAASGLKADFVDNGKTQINPHNGVLVITMDAGVGGLVFFLLITGSVLVALIQELWRKRQTEAAGLAVAAAIPLGVFWVLGDGLAALPISLSLMLIVGVFAAGRNSLSNREVPADVS